MLFLLGTADQGELGDVLVHKVQGDGVGSSAPGVSINQTQPHAGFHIVVWDLEVGGDDVPPPVVFHDGSGLGGGSTWVGPTRYRFLMSGTTFDMLSNETRWWFQLVRTFSPQDKFHRVNLLPALVSLPEQLVGQGGGVLGHLASGVHLHGKSVLQPNVWALFSVSGTRRLLQRSRSAALTCYLR